MPNLLRLVGGLLALAGVIWIFQGLGILTVVDSFMIGQQQWVVFGAIAVVAGAALAALSRRRPRT